MLPHWIVNVKESFKKAGDFEETGQTLVEYALILALVVIVTIAVLTLTGVNLSDTYERVADAFPNLSLFEKSITINYTRDVQGHIQWFIEGN
jgi:Flp pilus assembly pilin Flp